MAKFLLTVSTQIWQEGKQSFARELPINVNSRGSETWECRDTYMLVRHGKYNASEKKGFSGSAYYDDRGKEVFRLLDFFPLGLDPTQHRPGSEFDGRGTGRWIDPPVPSPTQDLEWTVIAKE